MESIIYHSVSNSLQRLLKDYMLAVQMSILLDSLAHMLFKQIVCSSDRKTEASTVHLCVVMLILMIYTAANSQHLISVPALGQQGLLTGFIESMMFIASL